jgi:1,4-dihydroxy-2-naphthoyl-CoA hydrolase
VATSDVIARRIAVLHPALMTTPTAIDTAQLHALVPLAATLGLRVAGASPDSVRVELDHRAELCTAGGVLHGGALMALADTAGAVCAYLNLPDGASGTTTVESKTNLLAAVRGGTVEATGTPLHVGSSLIVVETEVRRDDGRLAAKTIQTQAVLRG